VVSADGQPVLVQRLRQNEFRPQTGDLARIGSNRQTRQPSRTGDRHADLGLGEIGGQLNALRHGVTPLIRVVVAEDGGALCRVSEHQVAC
jgi:hypothetical protein